MYRMKLLTIFLPVLLLPLGLQANTVVEEGMDLLAMRLIGHELLLQIGDSSSRVLPIQRREGQFLVETTATFGFDPELLVSITRKVMEETGLADDWLVEVIDRKSGSVVYGFLERNEAGGDLAPCFGRILPASDYTFRFSMNKRSGALLFWSPDRQAASKRTGRGSLQKLFYLVLLSGLGWLLFRIAVYVYKDSGDKIPGNGDNKQGALVLGAYRFDPVQQILLFGNDPTVLTGKEAELLHLLFAHLNHTLSREVILEEVWGNDAYYNGRTLDVFVSRLRKKLKADPSVKIINTKGVGYRLVVHERLKSADLFRLFA